MPRNDLLALTAEDLAALTNRGTVKRAQRELEAGEATFTLAESDAGEVAVEWSDGVRCVLPAGRTAADGRCTCPSTTLCRHVVRSILAYQQSAAAGGDDAGPPAPPQAWDPGRVTDEQLAAHFKKAALASALARFEQGLLVELVRSSKPTARFHQLACSLRFVVPDDLRYTHCDCADPAPCGHVPLAVWAFRRLPPDRPSGIVSTQQDDLPAPLDLLDGGEALLGELIDNGFSGLPPTWNDRARRLEAALTHAELVWPAQVLADVAQQGTRYAAHDARFSPRRAAELVGEWLIRADAIRSRTRAVPQLLVRGSGSDRAAEIGSARYVGLGCGVAQDRAGVTVTAYLQDSDSGSLVAVGKEFADPAKDSKDPPKDFSQLAAAPLYRGISLAALGAGQLLLQGGKRAPDHQLFIGRAKASANPQAYAWESLRAPLLAADFGELRARLAALPPASLRPRYLAEHLHVVPVASVVAAEFDEADQSIAVGVRDARGEMALVRHPYVWRARAGCEALLAAATDAAGGGARRLRFVAGQVESTPGGLLIHPITLVFETAGRRSGIQPWVDGGQAPAAAERAGVEPGRRAAEDPVDALDHFPADVLARLGELLVLGLRRADAHTARSWRGLAAQGEALGYDRLVRPVTALADELAAKLGTTVWGPGTARELAMKLSVVARMAADLQEVG